MSIEQEIFENFSFIEERLADYGFRPEEGKLVYTRTLSEDGLVMVLEYDGTVRGSVRELDDGEEYTNFRREAATGYSAGIREKFRELLLDVRQKCCVNRYFRGEQTRRINDYIGRAYGGKPDFLWPKLPSYCAYRMPQSKKWYALIGSVPRFKVDSLSNSREEVELINVKVDSADIQSILSLKGYYPAFHMNKKSWTSIILDDTLSDEEIQGKLDESYKSVREVKDMEQETKDIGHCAWAFTCEADRVYHDNEWGVPVHDDRHMFEHLTLECLQCGLSWGLMMKKREVFRKCFDNFEYAKIAEYGDGDVERILNTEGMIKSERKIRAVINNARRCLEVRREFGSFCDYLWAYTGGKTILYDDHADGAVPVSNGLSERISRDMKKRGFKYVGPINIYSHLQACGMINDHARECPCFGKINEAYPTACMKPDNEVGVQG